MSARPNAMGEPAIRVTELANTSNARVTGLRDAYAGLEVGGIVLMLSELERASAGLMLFLPE
jgi:hypothetical protein